jgi:hypothetical protein
MNVDEVININYTGLSIQDLSGVTSIMNNSILEIECANGSFPEDYGFDTSLFYPTFQKISSYVIWKKKPIPPAVAAASAALQTSIEAYRNANIRKVAILLAIDIHYLKLIVKTPGVVTPLVISYIEEKLYKTAMTMVRSLPALVPVSPKPSYVYFPIGHGTEFWKAPRETLPAGCGLITRAECLMATQKGDTGFDELKGDILAKIQAGWNPCDIERFYEDIDTNKGKIKQTIFANKAFGYYKEGKKYPNLMVSLYLTTKGPLNTVQIPQVGPKTFTALNMYDSGIRPFHKIATTNFEPMIVASTYHPNGTFGIGIKQSGLPDSFVLPTYFLQNVIPQMYANSLFPTKVNLSQLFLNKANITSFFVENRHIFRELPDFDVNQNTIAPTPIENFIWQKITDNMWHCIEQLGKCFEFIIFTRDMFQRYPGTYYHLVCRGVQNALTDPVVGVNFPKLKIMRKLSVNMHRQGGRRKTRYRKKQKNRKTKKSYIK